MIQKYTYTKEELKEGMTTELSIDFESYVDDLAKWMTTYLSIIILVVMSKRNQYWLVSKSIELQHLKSNDRCDVK